MRYLRKIATFFLAAVILLTAAVPARAAAPEWQRKTTAIGRTDHAFVDHLNVPWPDTPTVDADTAFLVELNSGTVLYAKNAHKQMFPASITKIMTALVTIENVPLTDMLTLSHNSVTDLVWGGADPAGRFYEGQSFSVENGLYALCLDSVNTVGYALAEHISGSLQGFAALMNEKASAVGAVNTNFNNPHGLNDQTHLTTAHDMAKILWAAAENDLYRKIAGTAYYSFTDKAGTQINCKHGFKVFRSDLPEYDWRCVCGKTGYTSEAMYTRAVYATDGNLDLIAVVMHSDSSAIALSDVETLLNYGFNNFSLLPLPDYDAQDFVMTSATGRDILLTAGEMLESYPVPYLVPNAYAKVNWVPELISENGKLLARYSYGTLLTVTYPVWVDDPDAPEETTAAALPDVTGSTDTENGNATAVSTEDNGNEKGSGTARRVIVTIVLLVLLIIVLYVLAEMVLRQRRRRRRKRR